MHWTLSLCFFPQGDPGGFIGGFIPQKGDRGFPGIPVSVLPWLVRVFNPFESDYNFLYDKRFVFILFSVFLTLTL